MENHKKTLYKYISAIRRDLYLIYPVDMISVCQNHPYIDVFATRKIKSRHFCGMAFAGKRNSIVLNWHRERGAMNFDCGHEFIHLVKHRMLSNSFSCFDNKINQNRYIEWEANEGSAELIIPYELFIPRYIELSRRYAKDFFGSLLIVERLATEFRVSTGVIQTRIKALNYEIYSYMNGVPIGEIEVRSQRELSRVSWKVSHEKRYCGNCLGIVGEGDTYCQICGNEVRHSIFHSNSSQSFFLKGAGYMEYSKIELNENLRTCVCPVCSNTQHEDAAWYCEICGAPAVNLCTASNDPFNSDECNREKPLSGRARYCPDCGSPSSFLRSELLKPWGEERGSVNFPEEDTSGQNAIPDLLIFPDEELPF